MNWRTTAAAVLGALGYILTQIGYGFDSDPETVTNWDIVMKGVGTIIAALGFSSFGFLARDRKVSDEQSGAGVL